MERTIIAAVLFLATLFAYMHLQHQFKTSNELEVFVADTELSKQLLDTICQLRQPFVVPSSRGNSPAIMSTGAQAKLSCSALNSQFDSYEVHVRDIHDRDQEGQDLVVPLTWKNAKAVFAQDDKHRYVSEQNAGFLQESSLKSVLAQSDGLLQCPFAVWSDHDLWTGSSGTATPLRYSLNERNFFYVVSAPSSPIRVKLAPPAHTKHLHEVKDYMNFEFRSELVSDPWSQSGADKVKFLEVVLRQGECLFVPPFWWSSLQYQDSDSVVAVFSYRSAMNWASMLPHLGLFFMQQQNVKHKFTTATSMFSAGDVEVREEPLAEDKSDDAMKNNKKKRPKKKTKTHLEEFTTTTTTTATAAIPAAIPAAAPESNE